MMPIFFDLEFVRKTGGFWDISGSIHNIIILLSQNSTTTMIILSSELWRISLFVEVEKVTEHRLEPW